MLAKRIIPCLDVKDGRVVKGVRFLDLADAGDPVGQAKYYDAEGADEIVFLDITASAEKRDILIDVVRRTAEVVFIPLTVGGGIRTAEDARVLLEGGADKISINTSAVLNPPLISACADRFGSQAVVVAVDAKRQGDSWKVYTHGGRVRTELDAVAWAREAERLGAGEILLTSMDRDGTKDGYDLELTRAVSRGGDRSRHRLGRMRNAGTHRGGLQGRGSGRRARRLHFSLQDPFDRGMQKLSEGKEYSCQDLGS